MVEYLLLYIIIGFVLSACIVKPSKPYFDIVITSNKNFMNIVKIKFNEQITNKISSLFVNLSFFRKSTVNKLFDKFTNKSDNYSDNDTVNKKKISNPNEKCINSKLVEYITDDETYGQFVYFD